MIRKSLLIFIVFFGAFSLFLFLHKSEWKSAQYQSQDNVIKAQRYLYNDDTTSHGVIIGSSLTEKLLMDSLPGISNLAMGGLGVFDGLHILLKKEQLPKIVFIETNYFFKAEYESFINSFDSRAGNYVKTNLPALRDENQPVGIVKHYLKVRFMAQNAEDSRSMQQEDPNEKVLSGEVFSKFLALQQNEYNHPDTSLIKKSLEHLNKYVQEINKKGSRVCFLEMPVNPTLKNLPLANLVRSSLAAQFSNNPQVSFIKCPVSGVFNTTDGIHLTKYGKWEYLMYFKNAIKDLSLTE
jgi:hypothetical protein